MSRTMSRRQFVRAGAGVAAVTYLGGVSNAFGGGSTAFGRAAGGTPPFSRTCSGCSTSPCATPLRG